MIEVLEVSRYYGARAAVDGVSFSVDRGTVTGFLGPNGAGKSTTIRMLLGLERPTSGSILIDGEPYRKMREPLRRVGALLNAGWVNRMHTGRAHLRWIAASNGIPDSRVDETLDLVGLSSAAGRRTGTYSLGMLQRLGMANALLGDPDYLVLDEPGNGLDPEGIVWLRDLVTRLAGEGRGVLISSHLLGEIALVADDLVVIAQGRIRARTTVTDFVGAHGSAGESVYVRVADAAAFAQALDSVGLTGRAVEEGRGCAGAAFVVDGVGTQQITRLVAEHGIEIHEINARTASLEDAFMAAVSEQTEHRGRGLEAAAPGRVR